MRRREHKEHRIRNAALKGIMKLLLANPPLLIIIIVVIIGIVAYTLYSIDYQLTEIMKQYQSLSARVTDSKSGFDKRLFYVTTDENGNTTIQVGYSSEEEEEQAKKDLEDVGNSGGRDIQFNGEVGELKEIADKIHNADTSLRESGCIIAAAVLLNSGDPSMASALLGNSMHEAKYGQFQGVSANITLSLGSYNTYYKNKQAHVIGLTYEQLYNDLKSIAAWNDSSKTPKLGFGPTQATSSGNINTYVSILESMNLSNSAANVTESALESMEIAYCNIKFSPSALRNPSTSYYKGMKYTAEDVYNSDPYFKQCAAVVGKDNVMAVIQDTIYVIANYERFEDYKTKKSAGVKRSKSAVAGYMAMYNSGIIGGE